MKIVHSIAQGSLTPGPLTGTGQWPVGNWGWTAGSEQQASE